MPRGRFRTARTRRRTLSRVRSAVDDEDWARAITLGTPLLVEPDLPPDARSLLALDLGRAHLLQGEHTAALGLLEQGLEGEPPRTVDRTAHRYGAGMAALVLGDLPRARQHLLAAVADDGPSWAVAAARRGLAQVEAELGDLRAAERALEPVLADPSPAPMSFALQGMVQERAGHADEAQLSLMGARTAIRRPPDDAPLAEHATIASVLVLVASSYVELGYPSDATQALDDAARAITLAGAQNTPAAAHLGLLRAEVARLEGEPAEARRRLAAVAGTGEDVAELRPTRRRLAARIAWAEGDTEAAVAQYDEAADAFDAIGYRFQAQRTRAEARTGPPTPTTRPDLGAVMASVYADVELPDAVLVTFLLSDEEFGIEEERTVLQELAERLEDPIEAAGGELDGWETGGGTFTVYVYGDPDRCWPVMEPEVRAAATARGGHVVLRHGEQETHVELPRGE